MDIEERTAFLRDIDDVLANADNTMEKTFNRLGWSKEHLLNKSNSTICPYDHGHKIPESSLKQHTETCSWIKDGYTKEEMEKAVPSSQFFYENATTVVTVLIDKELQNHVLRTRAQGFDTSFDAQSQLQDKTVPRTMDRAMSELTTQERFAIYDYAIAQGKAANVQNIFQLEDLHLMLDRKNEAPQKEKSRLELLAELRDYKRRRQSYRAKNVHITQKTYTEVMRNLIDNQMQILNPTEQNDTSSTHASSGSSPLPNIKLEREEDDTTDFSYARKRSRDKSLDRGKSSNRGTPERDRSARRYSDDRSISSSKSYKRRRSHSHSPDKRESRSSRSSKGDHHHRNHHHSRESSKSHKKSHKKHKHSRHHSSSED